MQRVSELKKWCRKSRKDTKQKNNANPNPKMKQDKYVKAANLRSWSEIVRVCEYVDILVASYTNTRS